MPNPNLPPTHNLPPGHIDGLAEPLQIYSIESLRDQQADMLKNALDQEEINQGRPLTDAEKDAIRNAEYAKYDGEVEAYLNAHGIDPSHPDFAAYRDKLKELSIDRVAPSDWDVITVDPNDPSNLLPSPRDQAMNDMATNFATPVSPLVPAVAPAPVAPAPVAPVTPPASTGSTLITRNPAAQMALDEARAELARVTARRQGSLNFKFIPGYEERQTEFRDSQNEYRDRLIALVRDELQKEIAAGNYPDEADQRLYVAAHLMDSYKELQEATNEAMEHTKMGKFIKFMTSGGTAMRIIKGVGLGAVASGVGIVAGAVTGGGALALGAATGATLAGRLARGYAAFDAKAGRGMKVIETDDTARKEKLVEAGLENEAADAAIEKLSVHLLKDLNEKTDEQTKKRRTSAAIAFGLAAVGSVAAIGIHHVYDGLTSHGPSGGHPQGSGTTPEKPGGHGTVPEKPSGAVPEAPKPIEYSSDAYRISPGEGWYQTFQDMDIPQKDWSGLLEKVGPQLHDMQTDGHSLAYRMPNGEWGIRMTADGKMPQGALDAITHAHDQMTGHVTGGGASGTEVSSGSGGVEVPSTSSATAVEVPGTTTVNPSEISGLMQQTDISAADVQGNSAMEALTHVSPNLSPEGLGQRLHLPASEWVRLQEYIVGETNGGNKLYTSAFRVTENGYLRFTGNQIPAGTMADMLTHISPTVRYGLAA